MANVDVVHIAITHASGHLQIMQVVTTEYGPDGRVRWFRPVTSGLVDELVAKVGGQHAGAFGAVTGWRPIDPRDIPAELPDRDGVSRPYRNALRDTGAALVHDLEVAKSLALGLVRRDRAEAFITLDAAWMRAIGQRDQVAADAIEVERQTLRDRPQVLAAAFASVTTVADIDALVKG